MRAHEILWVFKLKHSEVGVSAVFLGSATAFDDRFLLLGVTFVLHHASGAYAMPDNMSQHAYGSSHSVSHLAE